MKGHESLVSMRCKGFVPRMVWLSTEPSRLEPWRNWPAVSPEHAEIEVEPSDNLLRIDLRCVHGLPVFVDGHDCDRVFLVAQACIDAGASRVVAAALDSRHQVVEITDTEGECKWPAG